MYNYSRSTETCSLVEPATATAHALAAAPTTPGLPEPSLGLRQRKGVANVGEVVQSSSSSLMDDLKPSAVRRGATKKSGSRLYRMEDSPSAGFWQKLGVLNPLLLMDMVFPMLHPASTPHIIWDSIMLVVVLYVAVVAPLRIAFWQANHLIAVHILEVIMTALLSLDVIVNFRTAYITSRGELVRDSRLVAARYVRGMFCVDVMAAIPFGLILGDYHRVASWLGLLKLIPLLRLIRLLKASGYVGSVLAMSRLLIFMLMVAHWAACFWHYLSEAIPEWPWMFTVQCPTCSAPRHYLLGFYSAFLLLLGDRPDANNNLERTVVTVLLFMGTLLYAVVVGSMSLLVASMWAMASRHKQRAAMVDDALRYRGVSGEVRAEVGEYFNYLAQFQHPGSDGVAFLQELPVGLYNTVTGSMFGPRLAKVQLFAHCERPFLWRLAQRLRLSLFMSGDTIYDIGSVGHDMYIIWKGAVVLVGEGSCIAALMSDGDHFGELGLMTASMPRPHRAIALKASDVLLLSRWDLQEAMKDFPESANVVKYRARSRLEDHEAPSGSLWAFLAGWEQLLNEQDDTGAEDRNDIFGNAGGARSSVDNMSYVVQSRAVMHRRERQVAEAAAAAAAAAAVAMGAAPAAPAAAAAVQQMQGDQQPLSRSDGSGHGGKRHSILRRQDHVAGPVAEAWEGLGLGPSSLASGQAPKGLRGLGSRLANLLRGRGQRADSNTGATGASASAAFAVQDDDDEALSILAASSGLSLRAPSNAALLPLIRQGHTQTAGQRRGRASPAGRQSISSSGLEAQQPTPDCGGAAGIAARCSARAWGSQDGAFGNGVRPVATSSRAHQSSVERPAAVAGVAAPGGGGNLTGLSSRNTHGLLLASVQVEEFSDDMEDEAAGSSATVTWRSPKGQRSMDTPIAAGTAAPNAGGVASHGKQHRHGRPAAAPLLAKRLTLHSHHPPPLPPTVAATAWRGSGMSAGGPTGCGAAQLPHQVLVQMAAPAAGTAPPAPLAASEASADGAAAGAPPRSPSGGAVAAEPQSQELPALQTLEEVWKQIQRAAETASQGRGQGQGQGLATPFGGQQQRPQTPPQPQRLQRQTSHIRRSSGAALAATPGLYGGAHATFGAPLNSQSSGPYGSGGGAAASLAAFGAGPLAVPGASMPLRRESAGCGPVRQGSAASSLPRLTSQGVELVAEGLDALVPAPPQFLTTRTSLGPFMSVAPPGMLSPAPRSPKSSQTGVALAAPTAAAGRAYTAAQMAASGSPAPLGARALSAALTYSRGRRSSYNTAARGARSSAGYTATSTGAASGRATGDGLTHSCGGMGIGSSDDSDDWSSDSSREETRRLVASLRTQLGQANARVLTLEAQVADVRRDPLKLPAVAAAVQREVSAAIARVIFAIDSRLSGVNDMLAQMAARAEDLSLMVAAADDRLQRLEDERSGGNGFQDSAGVAGAAGADALGAGGGGGGAGGPVAGSGRLLAGLVAAGLAPSIPSLEAIALARMSERRRTYNGGQSSSLALLNPKTAELRMAHHQAMDWEGSSKDWHRSLNAGSATVADTGGGGDDAATAAGVGNASRRHTGSRTGPLSPAVPLQGILKGMLHNHRVSQAGNFERSSNADATGLKNPSSLDASQLLPSLPGIIAVATAAAAADKDVSVRRGSRFFNGGGPPSSASFSGMPPPTASG